MVLNLENVKRVRDRQGPVGRAIDDTTGNRLTAPFVAADKLDRQIHNAWLRDPGDADIIGIDDNQRLRPRAERPRPPVAAKPPADQPSPEPPPKDLPRSAVSGPVPYVIIGGNAKSRANVDRIIRSNFSKGEIAETDGLVIEIGKGRTAQGRSVAGYYVNDATLLAAARIVSRAAIRRGAQHYIKIGNVHTTDDVITHELIHHLRARRLARSGGVASQVTQRASGGPFGDTDLEEAATDLESVSRHNPFQDPSGKIARPGLVGYYAAVVKVGRNESFDTKLGKIKQAELEDRAIVTLGRSDKHNASTVAEAKQIATTREEILRTSGLKNADLVNRIEQRFVDTNIADLGSSGKRVNPDRIRGKAENIDQYFAVVDPDGKAAGRFHFRTNKRREDLTDDAEAALGQLRTGQALVEMRDGKAVRLKGSSAAVRKFTRARAAAERSQRVNRPALKFDRRQPVGLAGVGGGGRSPRKLARSKGDR